jgi:hypothetical protein
MALVNFEDDAIVVSMSTLDEVLSFHGSFRIPLAHVTNATVSNRRDLGLDLRLLGIGLGSTLTAGTFLTHGGTIFCDLSGDRDCLLLETHGERFPKLAFTLDDDQDPGTLAAEIRRRAFGATS